MKRLTATFPTSVEIDLNALAKMGAKAIHLEDISSSADAFAPVTTRRKSPYTKSRSRSGLKSDQIIMQHYITNGTFSLSAARRWMEVEGLNPRTASAAITPLITTKHVERIGRSRYRFLREIKKAA